MARRSTHLNKNRFSPALTLLVCFAMSLSIVVTAQAQPAPMRYIYNAPESETDTRYVYHWKILETALQKTSGKYGPYVMEAAPIMSERRQAVELMNNTGKLTVMFQTPTPELDSKLLAVRIPVDRNLVGYRLFLIRKQDRGRFQSVRTLEDLKKFSFGQGQDWVDVEILRNSGLTVETGSDYEGLFEMLVNRRFDVFLRGAVEVLDELKEHPNLLQYVEIEPRLALYYPMPMYFWFAKTPEGERMAQRTEAGMRRMIADGTYDQIFSQYQDAKIRTLDLASRHIIDIPNPNARMDRKNWDRTLWLSPRTYRLRNTGNAAP